MLIRDFAKQGEAKWLVEGLLPAGHTILLAGSPGVGKSFISEGLAIAVASGKDYLGLPVAQGSVILVDEDTPTDELAHRLTALAAGYQVDMEGLPLYVHSMKGIRLDNAASMKRLEEEIKESKATAIVFDCLGKLMGDFNENNVKDCNAAAEAWEKLKRGGEATIVVLAHLNKREGKIEEDFNKLVRGSVAIVANSDTAFAVALGMHNKVTTFNVYPIERRRHLPMREPFGIKLTSQNGGILPQRTEIRKELSELAKSIWPLFSDLPSDQALSFFDVRKQLKGMAPDYEIRDALHELCYAQLVRVGTSEHNRYLYTNAIS